jgi:CTP synthase
LEKGIQADMLLCRSIINIPEPERKKIIPKLALFCNVDPSCIILSSDVNNVYKLPLEYYEQGVDARVLEHFGMDYDEPDMSAWHDIAKRIDEAVEKVSIAIVVKYSDAADAYKCLNDAVLHAGWFEKLTVDIRWIDAELLETDTPINNFFVGVSGIIVPGGFDERGTAGMIKAIEYARTQSIPYFGICFGLQLAVIEFARNVAGIKDANTTEFEHDCTPVICLMTEWWSKGETKHRTRNSNKGGTQRLGSYPCKIVPNTLASKIYGVETVYERHRHRYEMNAEFEELYGKYGLRISGRSPDSTLPEIIELTNHPFFFGVQFHPEFKSNPFQPHPIFSHFVRAAKEVFK